MTLTHVHVVCARSVVTQATSPHVIKVFGVLAVLLTTNFLILLEACLYSSGVEPRFLRDENKPCLVARSSEDAKRVSYGTSQHSPLAYLFILSCCVLDT